MTLTFVVLLTLAHVGVGGGGDSGHGSTSSSGGASGFSGNAFSNSTCPDRHSALVYSSDEIVTEWLVSPKYPLSG